MFVRCSAAAEVAEGGKVKGGTLCCVYTQQDKTEVDDDDGVSRHRTHFGAVLTDAKEEVGFMLLQLLQHHFVHSKCHCKMCMCPRVPVFSEVAEIKEESQ